MDVVLSGVGSRVPNAAGTDIEDSSNNNREETKRKNKKNNNNRDAASDNEDIHFTYTRENEIYDKTPEFDPEWDPD